MTLKGRWLSVRARLSWAPVVILITDGELDCVRGKLPPSMLKDFSELVKERSIADAIITVSGRSNERSFTFSASVDDSTRQRIRNVWYAYPERKITRV